MRKLILVLLLSGCTSSLEKRIERQEELTNIVVQAHNIVEKRVTALEATNAEKKGAVKHGTR